MLEAAPGCRKGPHIKSRHSEPFYFPAAGQLGYMDTQNRLHNLIGKRGLLTVANTGEISFPCLDVLPSPQPNVLPTDDFQYAISMSDFLIRFDEGTLVDGSKSKVVPGFQISHIDHPY